MKGLTLIPYLFSPKGNDQLPWVPTIENASVQTYILQNSLLNSKFTGKYDQKGKAAPDNDTAAKLRYT